MHCKCKQVKKCFLVIGLHVINHHRYKVKSLWKTLQLLWPCITIHIMYINTTGCIPLNKIPKTMIVACGAITDIWNVSVYIHIMDKNTTARHLWNKSEIIGSILHYSVPHKKCHAYFYHFPPIFWISRYLLHKDYGIWNQITGIEWPHTKGILSQVLSCHRWHSKYCEMLYQKLGAPWPSTWQHTIWITTTSNGEREREKCFI